MRYLNKYSVINIRTKMNKRYKLLSQPSFGIVLWPLLIYKVLHGSTVRVDIVETDSSLAKGLMKNALL